MPDNMMVGSIKLKEGTYNCTLTQVNATHNTYMYVCYTPTPTEACTHTHKHTHTHQKGKGYIDGFSTINSCIFNTGQLTGYYQRDWFNTYRSSLICFISVESKHAMYNSRNRRNILGMAYRPVVFFECMKCTMKWKLTVH